MTPNKSPSRPHFVVARDEGILQNRDALNRLGRLFRVALAVHL